MKENSKKLKAIVIEQLNKTPIVQVACEKIGLPRATFYFWKQADTEFAKSTNEAIITGRSFVNDLAESQLINAIKEKNLTAITYWLRNHHPDYANKLRIEHALDDEELTPEQEAVVREALRLAALSPAETINQEIYESNNKSGADGSDDQGQTSPSVDN